MRFVCETCGYTRNLPETPMVRCRCGTVCRTSTQQYKTDAMAKPVPPKPKPAKRHKPCIHRGPIIGKADCDCQTKPSVYACDLHAICLPRMGITAAVAILDDGSRAIVSRACRSCGDYRRT